MDCSEGERAVPVRLGVGGPVVGAATVHADGTIDATVGARALRGVARPLRPGGVSVDDEQPLTQWTDPVGAEQWQLAVDAAHAALVLESARLYGLVTGGPQVDVERCEDILTRGAAGGFTPAADAVDRFVGELADGG
jgi:hypothetical protein